ncbi:M48 family peptidase [Leptospira semungkisensis]|uniref:M48 family peptidase n=1 Tax=Leptospira semungkisensis TaxID=2484985 RepID=A0A4R9G7E3_9LEPT|nr:M48 family metallopeptidase [Leptospira semungkisensis]TGK07532.1 M48 family peptidase [Leptospira semungkisensis]
MKLKHILFFLFLAQIGFTLLMKYFSYEGDNSAELHTRILKYFTEEDIQSGTEYDRRGFFVSVLSSLLDFALAGIFVFTPISERLENYLQKKTKERFYLVVTSFFLVFYLVEFLVSLPFSYYFGFVLEHEFQFSNMTLMDWVVLKSKSFSLGLVFGTIGILIITFVLKNFPRLWKWMVPAISLGFGLIASVLFPILITPIFYDYHPIEEGSLKTKILALCDHAQIKVENIYVIDESRYSGHTNAYFTGWGENKKIFLYDTLIKNHTEEEVVSVLGHEIGHWVHNHQLIDIAISTFEVLLLCFAIGFLFQKAKGEGLLPLKEFYSPSSLPFLFMVLSIIGSFTQPISSTISRVFEVEADREALNLTHDKKSFISTEIKLAKDNKSRLNPHKFEVIYEHSHPTALERIEMAEKY